MPPACRFSCNIKRFCGENSQIHIAGLLEYTNVYHDLWRPTEDTFYKLLPCFEAHIQPVDGWDHDISKSPLKYVTITNNPFIQFSQLCKQALSTAKENLSHSFTTVIMLQQYQTSNENDQLKKWTAKLCNIYIISKQSTYEKSMSRHIYKDALLELLIY